jgi:hypothetical protein
MKTYLCEGFTFYNGTVEYKVLKFTNGKLENLALLERGTYCPYVVARDITPNDNGTFTWAWGHYFNHLENAQADFEERQKTLL